MAETSVIFGFDQNGTFLGVYNMDVVGSFNIIQSPDEQHFFIAAFNKPHTTAKNNTPGNELFVVHGPNSPYRTYNDAGLDLNRMFSTDFKEPEVVA